MNNFADNLVWLIRSRKLKLLIDLSKNDEQILETLKSTRCIMESLEWSSADEVKCLFIYLSDQNVNLEGISQNGQTPFHAAALNAKPDEMIEVLLNENFCKTETICAVDDSNQNAANYLLSEKSHCTDRLATFKALIILHNNGVKIDNQNAVSGDEEDKSGDNDNPEATSATTEEVTEVALSIKTESEADNEVKNDEKRTQPDLSQHLQLMLQQQLLNYHLALQQGLQTTPSSSIASPSTTSSRVSNGNGSSGVGSGGGGVVRGVSGGTLERPSVYNRRISSEQIELPDGRLCTRVPPRKWSKRDPEWELFQFECEFCPYFQDVRKYRRKAELVRHQALHFPEQARKFKCTICSYSATRNEYLKSHMANRHNVIQTPPREKKPTISIHNTLVDDRLINSQLLKQVSVNRPSMVPIGKPQVVRINQIKALELPRAEQKPVLEDKTVQIETIEANEESSNFGEYERDQIIPEELFTS